MTVEGWQPGRSEIDGDDDFPLVGMHFPVWDDNWPTVQAFLKVRTQWRVGAAGSVGLDYTAIDSRLRRLKLDDEDRIFEDITVMETAILAEWARQREADEARRKLGGRP